MEDDFCLLGSDEDQDGVADEDRPGGGEPQDVPVFDFHSDNDANDARDDVEETEKIFQALFL